MRKLTSLVLLTASLMLSGCKERKVEKTPIYFGDETVTAVVEFEAVKDVDDMITNKDNFLLVSYADKTCSCWSTFREHVLNPFIKESGIPIYVIETSLLGEDFKGLPISRKLTNTPVIGVYNEGVYKVGIAYNEDSTVFTQKDKFTKWLDRHIERPIMKFISFDKLNELLKGTKPFIINWSLGPCPDCQALNDKFMPGYLKDNVISQKLPYYLVETYDIRVNQPEYWTEIKKVYGLSEELNKVSGYGTGFVPALQVVYPDGNDYVATGDVSPIIKDMIVFQNEFIEKVSDVYKISDSYFNGVRGKTYLGEYASEIGQEIDASLVVETEKGPRFVPGARYEVNAKYVAKFFDYYWK